MKTHKFSKKEAIKYGWQMTKNNFWFFVGLMFVAGLIGVVTDFVNIFIKEEFVIIRVLLAIVSWFLWIFIGTGLTKISLNFYDQKKVKLIDLFSQYRLFFKVLLGLILYALIILTGFILLIIPSVIWSIKYQFFAYFIIDKKSGPVEALKRSAIITYGAKWDLFLLGLLLGFINLLGVVTLLIGLLVTVPIQLMASVFVYRRLLSQVENISTPVVSRE